MIGDIVGKLGRRTVERHLRDIRREHEIDIVVANGENAAGGRGLTPTIADEMYQAGVDIITSGNHIWEHRDIYPVLETEAPIVRPLNYPEGAPGRGIHRHDGFAVINLQGQTFMPDEVESPFRSADKALECVRDCRFILVDLHAEATSEKVALAYYLDGRISALIGTHTHIPTADTRILPKGTAYVSDVGMVGALHSVIGMETEGVLRRFLTQLPTRFQPAEKGLAVFNSVIIDLDDETGKAISIKRLDREVA